MNARILIPVSLLLFACGGSSQLSVRAYGEEFIEEGIPASEFSDGWSVSFDKFLVSVRSFSIAAGHTAPALSSESGFILDLAQSSGGEGFLLAEGAVPAGNYDHVSYRIGPAVESATLVQATEADRAQLVEAGAAFFIEGAGTKDGVTKRFAWHFTSDTAYSHCGMASEVRAGEPATVEFTVHGDHLFMDDLFEEDPNVAFQLIADADADQDGNVTMAELAATDLRTQQRYGVGSTGITTLDAFLRSQTTSVGHIDGEGHCEAERQ
jgi:hypothetical protein